MKEDEESKNKLLGILVVAVRGALFVIQFIFQDVW